MTAIEENDLQQLRQDVQRWLGRCMLLLQAYERLIKAIIEHQELSGSIDDLEARRDARIRGVAKKTLGMLAEEFLGSFLVSDTADEPADAPESETNAPAKITIRFRMSLPEEDFAQAERDLRELVRLRNDLVHQFVEQHDLNSVAGCLEAQRALSTSLEWIEGCYSRLREWAQDMARAHQFMADPVHSGAFQDLIIHGIAPDGSVNWPVSSLVTGFREAARALAGAEGKWVSVAEAAMWIAKKNPDRTPQLYGCKTWQQALQDSRLFDLRYDRKEGGRGLCFREKANPKSQDMPERTWELDGDGALILPQ